MSVRSHYPSFNVMKEQDAWDDHTQSIVASRLEPKKELRFFTAEEAQLMRQISSLLVNDQNPEVLDYVVGHIDQALYQSPGEGQREAGVPEASILVRAGLQAIERGAQAQYGCSFTELELQRQKDFVQQLSRFNAEPKDVWGHIPQKPLFTKLMSMTVEPYSSHPAVWSDIGYAGPAYPRGYVRTQMGQLDPWEAQPE